MSSNRSFYPTFPSLQHETQLVWQCERRLEAGEIDPMAAMIALNTIYEDATNPHLRRLCETIAFRLFGVPPVPAESPSAEPVVEIYAR